MKFTTSIHQLVGTKKKDFFEKNYLGGGSWNQLPKDLEKALAAGFVVYLWDFHDKKKLVLTGTPGTEKPWHSEINNQDYASAAKALGFNNP